MGFVKTLLFRFEFISSTLAWSPQITHEPNKASSLGVAFLSLSLLCLDLPMWPFEVCCVPLPGPVSNKTSLFQFLF